MAHEITREFSVEYAHRLRFHKGCCRSIHGHSGKILVTLELKAFDLPADGMIMDFADVKEKVGLVINQVDHALILHREDPVAIQMLPMLTKENLRYMLVDFEPTAENLSKNIYYQLRKSGLPVSKVVFYETEKNSASYEV